jgi:hypothetical protein
MAVISFGSNWYYSFPLNIVLGFVCCVAAGYAVDVLDELAASIIRTKVSSEREFPSHSHLVIMPVEWKRRLVPCLGK